MKIKNINEYVENMEVFDFKRIGPFLIKERFMKYSSKFLSREDYHEWIENDIRSFK
jgi:hypothetical protein